MPKNITQLQPVRAIEVRTIHQESTSLPPLPVFYMTAVAEPNSTSREFQPLVERRRTAALRAIIASTISKRCLTHHLKKRHLSAVVIIIGYILKMLAL